MASNVINRFSTIKRTILTLAGKVTLKDVLKANGRTGKAWVGRVTDVRDQVDDKVRHFPPNSTHIYNKQ